MTQAAESRSTGSQFCIASVTLRAQEALNEDAAKLLCSADGDVIGLAVADGLGSYTRAREAAMLVTDRTADLVRQAIPASQESLAKLFRALREEMKLEAERTDRERAWREGHYGTTLLVALETASEFHLAYSGNGAIWHLPGNFDKSARVAQLPWGAVNYLRPHSICEAGKECLYNILADAPQYDPYEPTILTVRKDRIHGDILLLCTDGLSSADQLQHGYDSQEELWIKAEKSMPRFYAALRSHLANEEATPDLGACIDRLLRDLRDERLLEDDTTLGLLVTATARDYQRSQRTGQMST